MPSTISAGTTAGTAIAIAGDTTGNLAFQTNGTTTAMTIDTSQNVGIGTTSPSGLGGRVLQIEAASNFPELVLNRTGTGVRKWGAYISSDSSFNIRDYTNSATWLAIDTSGNLLFNSGYGSAATAYGCRAWVNFNGTGTVAIRASGNVSSLTDVAVGTYWVNFTNAMPDANYCVQGNKNWRGIFNPDAQETGRVYMISADTSNNTQLDAPFLFVAIFR